MLYHIVTGGDDLGCNDETRIICTPGVIPMLCENNNVDTGFSYSLCYRFWRHCLLGSQIRKTRCRNTYTRVSLDRKGNKRSRRCEQAHEFTIGEHDLCS